jgi:hypothetical protein
MDKDRQTATLNYEISAAWEMKPRTTTQKISRLLMGPVQELKPCKLYDDDDDDDDEMSSCRPCVTPHRLPTEINKYLSMGTVFKTFIANSFFHKFSRATSQRQNFPASMGSSEQQRCLWKRLLWAALLKTSR